MKNNKLLFGMVVMGLFVLTISSIVLAEEGTISDLSPWEGSNETYINLFDTESGDELFEEIAKYAEGYNGEMVYKYFAKMYKTSFSKMKVIDAKTVVFDDEIKAEYKYIGNFDTNWGEHSISWYIFRTGGHEAIKAGYKNLILMSYHGHGKGMKHCHMRYGNQNFDFLITDPSVNNWWPTLYKAGQVDKERVVQGMIKKAKVYSSMLPSLKK